MGSPQPPPTVPVTTAVPVVKAAGVGSTSAASRTRCSSQVRRSRTLYAPRCSGSSCARPLGGSGACAASRFSVRKCCGPVPSRELAGAFVRASGGQWRGVHRPHCHFGLREATVGFWFSFIVLLSFGWTSVSSSVFTLWASLAGISHLYVSFSQGIYNLMCPVKQYEQAALCHSNENVRIRFYAFERKNSTCRSLSRRKGLTNFST